MSRSPSTAELLAAHAAAYANVPVNTQQRLEKSHSPAERRKRLGQIFADQHVSKPEAGELEYLKQDQANEEDDDEIAKAIRGLEALAKGNPENKQLKNVFAQSVGMEAQGPANRLRAGRAALNTPDEPSTRDMIGTIGTYEPEETTYAGKQPISKKTVRAVAEQGRGVAVQAGRPKSEARSLLPNFGNETRKIAARHPVADVSAFQKAVDAMDALAKGKEFWEKEDDDTSETAISPAVKAAAIKKFGKWSAVAAAWAVKKQKAKTLEKAAPKARRVGFNPGEPDFEGGMAKSQLRRACKYAEALEAMLKDGDELPAWVQDKISKASEYLDAAYHFLDYQSNGEV